MPHVRQILPVFLRRALPVALTWTTACSRDGELVIVLDPGNAAASMHVVAAPFDPVGVGSAAPAGDRTHGSADSLPLLRALDDSASRLTARFSTTRDSLNSAVDALDTAARHTRSYAVRYAEIRRRTNAAEQVREARNTVRARADSLRAKLAPRFPNAARFAGRAGGTETGTGDRAGAIQRHPVIGATLTLELEAGTWWLGLAAPGSEPAQYAQAIVRAGATDTLRLTVGTVAAPTGIP